MNKKQVEDTLDFHQVKKTCDAIRSEVAKIVIGYEEVVDDFLVCLIAQGHVPKNDTVQILSDTYDSIVEKGAEMKGVTRSIVVEIASK